MNKLPIMLILAILLAGCRNETPTPTEPSAPTLPPTAAATATLIPTATLTPTASQTPTRTPSPTRTATPMPSPTPVGFYANDSGFSLMLAEYFELKEENTNVGEYGILGSALFENSRNDTQFSVAVYTDDETCDLATYMEAMRTFFAINSSGVTTRELDPVTLTHGVTADHGVITVPYKYVDVLQEVFIARQNGRCTVLSLLGEEANLKANRSDLDTMVASVDITPARVYGLPRESVLVFRAWDPEPKEMDPARALGSAADFAGHTFSGLVRLNPQLQIEPDLAESWQISPSGEVYTFTLRSELAFSDGKPLTAHEVRQSWERAADPATESETARTYLGDILGVIDKLDGKAAEISGLQVVDDRTLRVTLDAPKPYFLAKLTYPTSFIIDPEQAENSDEEWAFAPHASGPYQIKEYREGRVLIYERNESYHTPAKTPYIVYLLDRYGDPASMFEAGEVDTTYIGVDSVAAIQQPDHPLHDSLQSAARLCTTYLYFNNTLPPMDDIHVRQALGLAIDKEKLVDQFTENLFTPTDNLLPPAMPGYSPNPAPPRYDPQAARQALKSSKYSGDMPTLKLVTEGSAGDENLLLDAILNMWREELGLEIEIEYIDPQVFLSEVRQSGGHIVQGGWCADYPDPQNFLDILFHSQGEFNHTVYTNPQVDALLEQARTELDSTLRLELYAAVERMLLEDYAALPLWNTVSFMLVNPALEGYILGPMEVPQVQNLYKAQD